MTAGHVNRVFALKFSPSDSNLIMTGGWDNTVQVWDTRCTHAIRSIFGPHICGDALDFCNNQILTGSWRPEQPLQLWEFGTGKLIHDVPWTVPEGSQPCLLYATQFNRNGGEFFAAAGSGANELRIFNSKTLKVVGEAGGFKRGIYALDYSPDGKSICIGGAGILRIFDVGM